MKTKNKLIATLVVLFATTISFQQAVAQGREYRTYEYHPQQKNGYLNNYHSNHGHSSYDHGCNAYEVKKYKKGYKKHHLNRYEYHHPRYGQVYRKFYAQPVQLRHHHGDYYFFNGHYYRHHHGVGYVRVELPGNVIFADLPFRTERIRHHGHVYYRYGNMYFEHCGHGYRPVTQLGLHVSAHF